MDNELIFRFITSLLVLGSLPPMFFLLKNLYVDRKTNKHTNPIQLCLLVIYLTFLISGLMTLYINIQFQFFGAVAKQHTQLALIRNFIKQVGIIFVSWRLYYLTKEGGAK